ncbi:probable pectate lyase P59 [Salvia hispanica]|uniref:probable pectate lyase P59 n=1 Tax=Salvia hispanica TaxID=49212 RepID=UPI002009A35B|nr:probable pectate lyase P59 [Salvia hispanica]
MNSRLILVIVAGWILPVLNANIGEWDEVWTKREHEARNRTLEAYHPNPRNVVDHLNMHVNRVLKEIEVDEGIRSNSSRRHLMQSKGPCTATNPIDKCWRCQANWADNRMKLADCPLGFAVKTTGGKGGKIHVVTDPSDDDVQNPKPGTLRHAALQKEPLWIIFEKNMVIKLKQELMVQSDKTIDGRGAKVEISGGAGITIQFVKNVIIHGIKISNIVKAAGGLIRDSVDHVGMRQQSEGDGITIFGSQNVWVDHVSLTKCTDGMIDATQGSTAVTISNCHLTDHDKTILFGSDDNYKDDVKMQGTVAFNHFGQKLVQRMPRCRFGYFHVVNNDYNQWLMYAIGGSSAPTIISQGNRFTASSNPQTKEVTKREKATEAEWKKWTWVSEGDVLLGGAVFVSSGDQGWAKKHPEVYDKIQAAPGTNVEQMTKFAGALECEKGKPC